MPEGWGVQDSEGSGTGAGSGSGSGVGMAMLGGIEEETEDVDVGGA